LLEYGNKSSGRYVPMCQWVVVKRIYA